VSRSSVEASLDAVERALRDFRSSLERAGFAAGAATYRQMADIIVGQWRWTEESGLRDLESRFLQIAILAGNVGEQLRPYVEAMDRLRGLRGLVMERWGVQPGSVAGGVLGALMDADGGLTSVELARSTGAPTVALRSELIALVERGLVVQDGVRGRFALSGAPAGRHERDGGPPRGPRRRLRTTRGR